MADTPRWFGLSHDVTASLGTLLSAANMPQPLVQSLNLLELG